MERVDEEKADVGMLELGWEVITVYRRDTLIRAGVRYARHAAMLRSRRPRVCDGPIKQKMLCERERAELEHLVVHS